MEKFERYEIFLIEYTIDIFYTFLLQYNRE